jgi:carbamoyltransferase
MLILGINAAFHDSAAALLYNGNIIAAAEEERFNRVKHGKRPSPFSAHQLPFYAINYCLQQADASFSELDQIAYSFDPHLLSVNEPGECSVYGKQDELFLKVIRDAPDFLHSDYPFHLAQKFRRNGKSTREWHFVPHHFAHAASAYYCSGFRSAAILVMDGRGEKSCTSYFSADNGKLRLIEEIIYPHSFGLLFEQLTSYLGFLQSSDEYKVMALTAMGSPIYTDTLRQFVHFGNGKYSIDPIPLETLFGPARNAGEAFQQVHYDLTASYQQLLEETVLKLCLWLKQHTQETNLCLAGGVFLNCLLNSTIWRSGEWENIFIQPAAGDAGTALGAAQLVYSEINKQDADFTRSMKNVYLGPEYSNEYIEHLLQTNKINYHKAENLASEVAEILADNKIVAWFQGRMEFGPRALGSRSILASPLDPSMQQRLNFLKEREDFRPVAPVVPEEKFHQWFEGPCPSNFMLYIHDVKKEKAELIPSALHTDGTARVQTITSNENPIYHSLLIEFEKRTGIPVLINTSFNAKGEPIVCTPEQAIACFYNSPLDALAIGSFIIQK